MPTARVPVPPACGGPAPNCVACLGKRQSDGRTQLVTIRFCAGLQRHRPCAGCEVSVPGWLRRGHGLRLHEGLVRFCRQVFSSCPLSPKAGNLVGKTLEDGNLRCRKISPFSLAQKGNEINGRVQSEVGCYDPIASTFPLATSGKADFTNTAGAGDDVATSSRPILTAILPGSDGRVRPRRLRLWRWRTAGRCCRLPDIARDGRGSSPAVGPSPSHNWQVRRW
jgi:hypothetical protein